MMEMNIKRGSESTNLKMKSNKGRNKRQVNIELLRIFSMLMVLVIHYNVAVNGQTTHDMVMTEPWKAIGVASLKSLSFICVNCFIIISGYFGIRWKWKSLCNYLFQIGFWGGMIHLIAVGIGFSDFSVKQMLDNMFMFLVHGNWFFVSYLGLYMLAPVLNAYIEKVETRQLGWMVLTFYAFQTVFGWIFKNCIEFSQGLTFVSFMGLYLLGAFLRRSNLNCFRWRCGYDMGCYLGFGFICVVLSMGANYMGFDKDVYSYISPLQILQTVYLFLFFKKVRVSSRYDQVILFFSSSAFAALLMHSWDGVNIYASGLQWIDANLAMPFVFTMLYIFGYFISACCLDKIRLMVWNKICIKYFVS